MLHSRNLLPFPVPTVLTSVLCTGGLYSYYWLWQQSRMNSTSLDLKIQKLVNIGFLLLICLFCLFPIFLTVRPQPPFESTLSNLVQFSITVVGVSQFICFVIAAVLVSRKINLDSEEKMSVLSIILLSVFGFLSVVRLQYRINLLHHRTEMN
jgi:hypothetical protein